MPDPITTILVFVAVIAVTALLFGAWLVAWIVTLCLRLLTAPLRLLRRGAADGTAPVAPAHLPRCGNQRCRADNPSVALFCRRCGATLQAAQSPAATPRRVALW